MKIETEEEYNKAIKKYEILKDHYQDNDEQKEFIELADAIYSYELENHVDILGLGIQGEEEEE